MRAFKWTFTNGIERGIEVDEISTYSGRGSCAGAHVHPSLLPGPILRAKVSRLDELIPEEAGDDQSGIILRPHFETIPKELHSKYGLSFFALEEVKNGGSVILEERHGVYHAHQPLAVGAPTGFKSFLVVLPRGARIRFGFKRLFSSSPVKLTLENRDGQLRGMFRKVPHG